jgi:hypothetical protein
LIACTMTAAVSRGRPAAPTLASQSTWKPEPQ